MRREPRKSPPDKVLHLACGHRVTTNAPMQLQYPDDYFLIPCESCRKDPTVPLCWMEVTGAQEITRMSDVLSRLPQVMRSEVLRMQPSVPSNRRNLFPYRK